MAVTAKNAFDGVPVADGQFIVGDASGTSLPISPGDYVAWSANYLIATEDADATWKVSGAGIALDRNPAYDWAGREVVNSAVVVARYGLFHVTAAFSGKPLYGVLAFPASTGSGVNAPSGATGLGATWGTGTPVSVSGGTGAEPVKGVAQVVGWSNGANAGTGELDIVLWDRNADYY